MYGEKIFRSKVLALGVILSLLLLFYPAEAWTQTEEGTGSLEGYIFMEDLKTPSENAVVKIRNIEDGLEQESPPTDDTGAYEISDVREGRYLIGVTTPEGNFNFDYVVSIKANETAKLSMAVKPGAAPLAGQEEGVAAGGFFSTTTGILVIIGVAALLTLGVITLATPSEPASPGKKKIKK